MVVNFAAESHVDRSITDPEAFVRTNVMGTTTLLDACRTYGIKRYHQVPLMRCTATCLLTDRTFSLQRKLPCTPPALIPHPRQALICLCWRTTGPTACR